MTESTTVPANRRASLQVGSVLGTLEDEPWGAGGVAGLDKWRGTGLGGWVLTRRAYACSAGGWALYGQGVGRAAT